MTPTDPSGPVRGGAGLPVVPAEESAPPSPEVPSAVPPAAGRWVWAREALREQRVSSAGRETKRLPRQTGSAGIDHEGVEPESSHGARGPVADGAGSSHVRGGHTAQGPEAGPGTDVRQRNGQEPPTGSGAIAPDGRHLEAEPYEVPEGAHGQEGPRSPESPDRSAISPDIEVRVAGYQDLLLGGRPCLTARELAERTGTPLGRVDEFWLAMGFRTVGPDEPAFTVSDLDAYGAWSTLIDSGAIDLATGRSLLRAQSHISDRLALWQVEALVEDVARRQDLDDTQARRHVLESMGDRVDFLEHALVYSWRRQLESLITRVDHEVTQRGPDSGKRRFPLTRSLGFVDMVSYTSSSTILGGKLVGLIERFEDASRTAVTAAGGRVVKMIGDAVLFIADDLTTGLRVVTSLIEALGADDQILPVRASFVRGDVFSRSGDVFGPPVNLASRLVDIAPEGRILTDATTAAAIAGGKGGSGYHLEDFPSAELRGFGTVSPYLLARDLD